MKFRASFSVLNLWDKGRIDWAINSYFKLEEITNQAMDEGKELHEYWQQHTKETKRLPKEFGNIPLINPQTELKLEYTASEWLELVGVIDCLDNKIIYEYKTGKTRASAYKNTYQAGMYALLTYLHGIKTKECQILHYDQHKDKSDSLIIPITDELIEKTSEWIENVAWDMRNFIIKHKLEEKYKKNDKNLKTSS